METNKIEAKIKKKCLSNHVIYKIIGFNNEKEGEFVLFRTEIKSQVMPEYIKCLTSIEIRDNFKEFYIIKEHIRKEKFSFESEDDEAVIYEMPEMKKINDAFKKFCENAYFKGE